MELLLERPTVQKGEKMRGTASIKLAFKASWVNPQSLTWVLCRLTLQKGRASSSLEVGKKEGKKRY
jgi:hypothetical protein